MMGSPGTAAAVGAAAAAAFACGRCMPCEASSGKYPMHDGATTMRWNQANPRPLPSWTAPERAKHEWLIREAFKLANQAVDNGNCPYAGLLATAVNADGSGGEIKLRHCNGVHGKDVK